MNNFELKIDEESLAEANAVADWHRNLAGKLEEYEIPKSGRPATKIAPVEVENPPHGTPAESSDPLFPAAFWLVID